MENNKSTKNKAYDFVNHTISNVPMYLIETSVFSDQSSWTFCMSSDEGYEEFTNEGGYFPMWGTAFFVNDMGLCHFIDDNREAVCNMGFVIMIYDTYDDMYLGIDGAGYDFYEHHWIPLYKAYMEYLDNRIYH